MLCGSVKWNPFPTDVTQAASEGTSVVVTVRASGIGELREVISCHSCSKDKDNFSLERLLSPECQLYTERNGKWTHCFHISAVKPNQQFADHFFSCRVRPATNVCKMSDSSHVVGTNCNGTFEEVLLRLHSLEKRVDRIDGNVQGHPASWNVSTSH